MHSTDLPACINAKLERYFKQLKGEQGTGVHKMVMQETESVVIKFVLEFSEQNQSKAASILGLNRGTLHRTADNLLNREFSQQKSNTHWVGDITYIKTYQGWSYLASVLDLASRQVVGWSLSKQPNAKLAQDALDNAINRYKPNTKYLMFHSDQGTQYSSKAFIDYCGDNNITQSMSRKGNCWDNAVMERFFRSLKTERLNYQSFANHYEVVQNVESYIYFYNYKRIHSAIGYLTPAQKMAELEKVA
jgi:transposase InsO family protein